MFLLNWSRVPFSLVGYSWGSIRSITLTGFLLKFVNNIDKRYCISRYENFIYIFMFKNHLFTFGNCFFGLPLKSWLLYRLYFWWSIRVSVLLLLSPLFSRLNFYLVSLLDFNYVSFFLKFLIVSESLNTL